MPRLNAVEAQHTCALDLVKKTPGSFLRSLWIPSISPGKVFVWTDACEIAVEDVVRPHEWQYEI